MPVSPQNVIVMEVIHECLGHLQNAETDVNGLVEQNFLFPHVYDCQVIVDAVECFAIGLCHEFFEPVGVGNQLHVHVVPDILHCFAIDTIIKELKEILLKIVSREFALFSVFIYVGLHECRLLKGQDAVHFCQFQSLIEVEL